MAKTDNPDAVALVRAIQSRLFRDRAIQLVSQALRKTHGNVKAAAKELGMLPRPIYRALALAPELQMLADKLRGKAPPIPRPSRRRSG